VNEDNGGLPTGSGGDTGVLWGPWRFCRRKRQVKGEMNEDKWEFMTAFIMYGKRWGGYQV